MPKILIDSMVVSVRITMINKYSFHVGQKVMVKSLPELQEIYQDSHVTLVGRMKQKANTIVTIRYIEDNSVCYVLEDSFTWLIKSFRPTDPLDSLVNVLEQIGD